MFFQKMVAKEQKLTESFLLLSFCEKEKNNFKQAKAKDCLFKTKK